MTIIPLVDLKAAYGRSQVEIDAAVTRVLAGGWYILGPEVSAFEAEFAAYLGVADTVGVASGTDAVLLALRALGVGPGDEVITVAHTAVATVTAIELCGATPRLVDIDPVTYTLDPAHLAAAITPRTRAIVPVHHFHRAYGKSQFFRFRRLAQVARDLSKLWVRLVWRKEAAPALLEAAPVTPAKPYADRPH